jgi:hypothetical protein
MRAWAAKVGGRGRKSFCEQCGVRGPVRATRKVADRPRGGELLLCRGCSLMTCATCWPGPFLVCRACWVRQNPVIGTVGGETSAPERAPTDVPARAASARARPHRVGVLAAAAVVVLALLGGAIALARPESAPGGVAGVIATSSASPRAPVPAVATSDAPASATAPTPSIDPADSPTPSPVVAARPGTPADLRVTASAVRPWVDELGELRAQVLVGVTNQGGSAGYLPSSASAWEVSDAGGFAVSRGRFAHVFPRLVEPGATAWLVDALSATFTERADLGALTVTLDERAATAEDRAETGALTVGDVTWRLDAAGRLSVSGVVENVGDQRIGRWSAGVVLVAADGTPLAAAYEIGDVDGLAPGGTARFSTSYPGSAPVAQDEVDGVIAAAVPLD